MTREQQRFEGLDVADIEVEITGGGRNHETDERVGGGDEGTALVHWKCVNVKHPFKAGETVRVQTLNITAVKDVHVTQKFKPEPKAEQQELVEVD